MAALQQDLPIFTETFPFLPNFLNENQVGADDCFLDNIPNRIERGLNLLESLLSDGDEHEPSSPTLVGVVESDKGEDR